MLRSRLAGPRTALLAALLVVALVGSVLALGATGARTDPASAASESQLRSRIDGARGQESRLSSLAARLGGLERSAARALAVSQQRLAEVQVAYEQTQAKLATTTANLAATKKTALRLRARLQRGRVVLAQVLRAGYTEQKPDIVSVVVQSRGFGDLLDRVAFMRRVQQSNTNVVDQVRDDRLTAVRTARRLTRLQASQKEQADAVARQRAALSSMTAGLERRRTSLAEAKAARLRALKNTRADRRSAERSLSRLQARQAAAAKAFSAPAASSGGGSSSGGASSSTSGGGGTWSIPWAIVQCESGGQNVPPNSAGASGYYQFMRATWKALGGSTSDAYKASRAEQDRLAAKLWNGGAGASNWDCAAIVGITG